MAPLDTVLRQQSDKFEPLLRFFALFNRHIVVTDSQLLDNGMFREQSLSQNLDLLFQEDSGDGLPLFLVSQRASDRSLKEILVADLAKAGDRPPTRPMFFSSLTQDQQARLENLHARRKLTLRSLSREVGYDVDWLQRISRCVKRAQYASKFAWPAKIDDSARYHELLVRCLECQTLARQAGIQHPATRNFLKRLIEQIRQQDPSQFSRSLAHRVLDEQRRGVAREDKLWAARKEDINKAFGAVRAMVSYAYLRNFADSSSFPLLLDHTHWLASSIVNKELRHRRQEAELADALVEKWLDLQEGAFEGFGTSRQLAMSQLLKSCGFSDLASWQKIMALRRDTAFGQRLSGISRSKGAEASDRLYDHARICLEQLLGRTNWQNLVVQGIKESGKGVVGEVVKGSMTGLWTATGFAVPAAAAALAVGWRGLHNIVVQPFLIDRLGTIVADELKRLSRTPIP
ncbi:MAG TPA: hypothetical protein VMP01_12645 [Pirellulaceae bacterium]|nr:hypothetical protein [Pirellulaceae bacterium]